MYYTINLSLFNLFKKRKKMKKLALKFLGVITFGLLSAGSLISIANAQG